MESMTTDGENHADLFGGDLFSDELLDIYSSSNGDADAAGNGVVNDMSQILDQTVNGTQIGQNDNGGVNPYVGVLGELNTSTSMNDFTSILEEGNTPTKRVDSMLKLNNVTPSISKKRPADSQLHAAVKKKATTAKSTIKATVNKGINATIPRRVSQDEDNIVNSLATKPNTTNNVKVEVTNVVHTPAIKPVAPQIQQKVQSTVQAPSTVPPTTQSTYQPNNMKTQTPRLVSVTPKSVPVSSKSSVSSVKTEESFKGVAQAAVNNLILSAGQNSARYEAGKNDINGYHKSVDTSTTHVAALTSNNWVAACAAGISDAPPGTAEAAQAAALAAASDPAAAKAARARRASLSADERARQNRDRNREHARNTRLRKKAYVEELKRTLTELVTARDATELERRHEKQRELEVREVRYRVMEEFLKLRARGSETNLLARWIAILEDGFSLTIPTTDYREMVHADGSMPRQVSDASTNGGSDVAVNDPTVQVLRGATECFDDASKIAAFFQTMSTGNVVQEYNCDRKQFMMDGVNAMLEWTLTTNLNGDNSPSIFLKGCMRAMFSPASNKLVCAELLFDSSSVVSQVKSLVSYADLNANPSGFSCIAEADAILDSVLPQAPQEHVIKQESSALPCSVSVVSDKGETETLDEEYVNQQKQQVQMK